jgi:hypothetical protein
VPIRFRQYLCRRWEADLITIFEALEAWKDLLVATAGASAALAGLVTVAIATNIGEILKFPWLPSRAATSIALLVLVLVVSIAGLMRPQSLFWFGVETVAFAALAWLITARTARIRLATRRVHKRPVPQLAQEIGLYQIGVLPCGRRRSPLDRRPTGCTGSPGE